jgi:dihydrofolate reductase
MKIKAHMSISVDGYVAGPNQSEDNPLGEGGMQVHDWMFQLQSWREAHGEEGGEANVSDQVVDEMSKNAGAGIMGRNMFGPIRGDWGDESWNGWWGDEPPYGTPVYVLTHHPREPVEMEGGTTFHFVTDGIESALEQASKAAGEKDIHVHGGASTVQQYLAMGAIDEIALNVAPVLLGQGERLFDNLPEKRPGLELERTIAAPNVTHLKYVVKN